MEGSQKLKIKQMQAWWGVLGAGKGWVGGGGVLGEQRRVTGIFLGIKCQEEAQEKLESLSRRLQILLFELMDRWEEVGWSGRGGSGGRGGVVEGFYESQPASKSPLVCIADHYFMICFQISSCIPDIFKYSKAPEFPVLSEVDVMSTQNLIHRINLLGRPIY